MLWYPIRGNQRHRTDQPNVIRWVLIHTPGCCVCVPAWQVLWEGLYLNYCATVVTGLLRMCMFVFHVLISRLLACVYIQRHYSMCVCMWRWICASLWVWANTMNRWSWPQQSRIKSILILARQEPELLLGDRETERKEKTTNAFSSVSVIYPLPQCRTLQLSVVRVLLLLRIFTATLSGLSLLFQQLLLLISLFSFPLSLLQWGAGTGGWQTALCGVQGSLEISAGSRRFIKTVFSIKITVHFWREGTGPTHFVGNMDL